MRFRTQDVNRRLSEVEFRYYECSGCGVIFLSPAPDDLGAFYPPDYYGHKPGLADLARAAEAERYKLDLIRRGVEEGRLLEVGPGMSPFAYLAKENGFDVHAIEMDAGCCRFLEQILGVHAIESDDPATALASLEPFDAIALWHVIEHLPEPWATLTTAARTLAPGGVLAVATPNPASLQFRLLGGRWTHVDAPRHLRLIPLQTLLRHASEAGLEPVTATSDDAGSRFWNSFGWRESMAGLASRPRSRELLRRGAAIPRRVLSPFEESGFRGSTYSVLFRAL